MVVLSGKARLSGSLVAHAAFVLASSSELSQYAANSASAINTLQNRWYDVTDGLWNSTGWWNAANCLTTLADYAQLDTAGASMADLASVFSTTFHNAQAILQTATKTIDAKTGLVGSMYVRVDMRDLKASGERSEMSGFPKFINNYYDDEGWWALAWQRAFDVTGRKEYLDMSETIFADMQGGTKPEACGGGIWWSKDHTYKNAIANELYFAAAAGLANRALDPEARASYRQTATEQWAWFHGSGMISPETGLVSDGLTIHTDGSCVSNNGTAWSYNQGVVLGGLVELVRAQEAATGTNGATVDKALLPAAVRLALTAMNALSSAKDWVLHEPCEANGGSCGGDGSTFKGVFVRNLQYLHQALAARPGTDDAAAAAIRSYLMTNADAIWSRDRDADTGELGLVWSGPPTAGGAPTAATHDAGMDCLVAAMAVAQTIS